MTVYCIECGDAVDAAARTCDGCGAAQPIDDVAAVRAEPVPETEEPVMAAPVAVAVAPSPPPPASDTACPDCGRPLARDARFCGGCGSARHGAEPAPPPPPQAAPPPPPQAAPPPPPQAAPPPPPQAAPPPPRQILTPPRPAEWQSSLPAPLRSVPPEVLAVCAMMALAGILTLWPALKVLPDVFELLGTGGLARSIGWFLLSMWTLLAFFGGACLFLAWRLTQADRVARGLTYVLAGGLALSILIGNQHTTGLTIVMLTAAGAVAVLALASGSRAFFAGGKQGEHPDGLVIARTIVSVWAAIMVVVGLTFLPLGGLGGKFVVVGVFLVAIGAVAFHLNGRLAEGDETARIIVSAGAAAYLVLLLVLGDRSPGLLLPLAMVVGVAGYLWIPADVQQFFARRGMR